MRRFAERVALASGVALVLYIGVYIVFTVQGRYEPLVWGLTNVKVYAWFPQGFSDDRFKLNLKAVNFFYPAWIVDNMIWHTEAGLRARKYPIHSPYGDKVWSPDEK
jgi:hypothetical protein